MYRDSCSVPGLGRLPGERNGNPFQYSCLENPMDREAWWATVHAVAKSQTWLVTNAHTHTHTHIFNWRIIALEYCVSFCHISTWISHRHTYIPSLLNLSPTSHHSRLAQGSGLISVHHIENSHRLSSFTYGYVYVSMLLSQFVPPSPPPPMSLSLFSMSPLLPCR